MRAGQLMQSGDGYDIVVSEGHSQPTPAPGELLIKVAYAGINHADLYQVQGRYPLPEETDHIPGLECAGEVVALGEDVHDWEIGGVVCGLSAGGCYAEYVTIPAAQCLAVPKGISVREAACFPEALATVWLTVCEQAKLHKGETLLVHGGSSGIGVIAIQLANIFGAQVIVTAGTDEKCGACEQLGARAINYKKQDFVAEAKRMTDGKGVDVVLDMVGGSYVERNFKAMAPLARMVSIALIDGAKIKANIGGFFLKNLSWRATTLRSQTAEVKAHVMRELQAHVLPKIADNTLKAVIDSEFSLENVEKAHQRMHQSLHVGKILLNIGASSN